MPDNTTVRHGPPAKNRVIRLSDADYELFEAAATKAGFKNRSAFLRYVLVTISALILGRCSPEK